MMKPKFVLYGMMLMQIAVGAFAMKCQSPFVFTSSCPNFYGDKEFCCYTADNIPYCCGIEDYIQNNPVILAGILLGALTILIVVTLCCCCFCSCCLLGKRRTHQGTNYSDPAVSSVPLSVYYPSPYPMQSSSRVHAPPPATSPSMPPSPNRNQSPVNPNYIG